MTFDHYARQYDEDLQKGIRISGETKEFFIRGRLALARDLFERVGFRPRRILEFGCGIGNNLTVMRELWPDADLVGLDNSETSLEVARERFGSGTIRLRTPEGHRQVREEPADWVYCNGVLHHIPVPEREGALRTIRDLLRDGGVFSAFENNPFNPGARLVMRMIPFDRDAVMINPYHLAARLATLRFERISCHFLFAFPRFLSLLRPLEPYLRQIPIGAQYGVFAFRR
ncbi:MAG TPA: class I SAM-dependent methyltransferase [Candidatus Polarisedimenticolia bacterium]|nr:class I SAM-dependent methyltransferase [Candidatus Polarisedimenticolia bacterium]